MLAYKKKKQPDNKVFKVYIFPKAPLYYKTLRLHVAIAAHTSRLLPFQLNQRLKVQSQKQV